MILQKTDNQRQKSMLVACLMLRIIDTKNMDKVDKTKINRLLYLLWLEYAHLYPENTIPHTSPMNLFEFYNYELGPVELSVNENFSLVKEAARAGSIKFKDVGFSSAEQIHILAACEFMRRYCAPLTTQELADFVVNHLPAAWMRPRYNKIEYFKRGVFEREIRAYKNKRVLLKRNKTK